MTFSQPAHSVILLARKEALSFGHTHLGNEHLLLGLGGESASDRSAEAYLILS